MIKMSIELTHQNIANNRLARNSLVYVHFLNQVFMKFYFFYIFFFFFIFFIFIYLFIYLFVFFVKILNNDIAVKTKRPEKKCDN